MSTGLDSMHPARALACRRFLWLVALLAIALSADPALADEDGRWQDFRFPIAPAPRFEHVFVFDEDQDRIILFGNSPEQDTWALSVGETPEWLQLTPTRYPPPRIYPAAVYDPIRKRVVMFGGRGTSLLNDVWVLEGTPGDWREIHPEGLGPSGRVGSTAVYDRARDRIIVYGGMGSQKPSPEVWALYLSGVPRWQLINNAGPALWGHSAIYDPVGDRMIVAFGSPYASPVATNDVWELALSGSTRWTSLSPLLASARFGASLVHDPVRRRMLVFGGVGASDSNPWAMDLTGDAGWIPLTPTGDQPHKRWYSGCAYSPFYDEVFMFGGANGTTVLGDTWSLVFGSRPAPPPPPSLRSFSPAVGSAGEIVTLEGEHFIGVRAVHFMGVPAPILDTAEARIITRVPLGATTGRIVVFGVHGQTTSLTEFTVTPAVPRIDSIVPAAAKIGAWVRIHGANFFPGISVYSGTGSMVENVVRLSDSLLAARTDSATAGYLIACFPGLCSNTLAFQSIPLDGRALSVSVRDVPDDEGGRVLVEWMPGDLDNRDRAILTTYRVWRRSPESPAGSVRASREDCRLQESPAELEAAGWERLGDVPARQAERYSFVAETLQDSVAGSNPETAFFVQSLTHAPMSSFSSAISEGHSVDNRAPATPAAFDLSYSSQGVTLRWTASSSPDLLEYRVYRGVTRDFEPSSRNLEVVATDTTCVVGFGSFFYKLEAVDVHGNRGAAQVASSEPPGLSLDRIHPNPSLARAALLDCVLGLEVSAALDVYDVTGRLALHRGLGSLGPGRHRLAIDSEGRLAPGVYLARLRQGREMRTVRFVVLGSR